MRVRLLLFAILRDVVGESELSLEVQDGTTAADLWTRLQGEHALLERYSAPPMFAVNERYVAPQHVLVEGDEVALIPPVSGG